MPKNAPNSKMVENPEIPVVEVPVRPRVATPIILTLDRTLSSECKRTRMLKVEGATGIKHDPLYEVDSIQRALGQVRGTHPPPIMIIDSGVVSPRGKSGLPLLTGVAMSCLCALHVH